MRNAECGMRNFAPFSSPVLHGRTRRGFVLMEVLVSLVILGISLTAIMRSFTQSLNCVRIIEVQTQSQFFAMQLMHEMEINPPREGDMEGDFGEDYKAYSYQVHVEYDAPQYGRVEGAKDVERYIPMKLVTITIHYNDGVHKPFTPVAMNTAIIGFEKLSPDTKRSYGYF